MENKLNLKKSTRNSLNYKEWLRQVKKIIEVDRSKLFKARNLYCHDWTVEGAAQQLGLSRMKSEKDHIHLSAEEL